MIFLRCLAVWWVAVWMQGLSRAANLYVGPQANFSGNGSRARPYDLKTALSGEVGKPGDTFWIREGIYPIGHIASEIHGAAGQPITVRQLPGEHAQVVGSLTLWGQAGYVIFRDFELCSGAANRLSSQKGMSFKPTDLPNFCDTIQVYSPNLSFINLVVHDSVRSAFYTSCEATNTLIYGCIVYNAGWASPDNAEGHSFYLQGAGEFSDNVAFNSAGANFHVYSDGKGGVLKNLTLDGNVAFGAGALQRVRPYRDWIVGVDSPAVKADSIILRNNMGFLTTNSTTLTQVQVGREQVNGKLLLSSNYWPQGLIIHNWRNLNAFGNLLAPPKSDFVVDLQQNLTGSASTWNSNAYFHQPGGKFFRYHSKTCDFSEWKKVTGYDSATPWETGCLTGTRIVVRPNRYEPGRANIVVYNWDNLNQVRLNICPLLSIGDSYELRNAQDFFAVPVLRGAYDGRPLTIPMNGLTVAEPTGGLKTPPPTGPTFNVFVLLSNREPSRFGYRHGHEIDHIQETIW